jgi:biopolymer transport protein ExbD
MAMSKLPGDSADEGADGVFADINITPLTDIFLVLLIIFMVTSSAMVESQSGSAGVKVNLPKGGATDVRATQTDLAVAVLVDGRTVLGGKVMTPDELKAAFSTAKDKNPDTTVIVQADAGVPHGKVVDVMELAKGAGLAHLAIATRAQ